MSRPQSGSTSKEVRSSVMEFLEKRPLKTFLADPKRKALVMMRTDTTVAKALSMLAEAKILSAPVENTPEEAKAKGSKYAGFIDVRDIVAFVLMKLLQKDITSTAPEELPTDLKSIDEKGIELLSKETVKSVLAVSQLDPFVTVKTSGSIADVMRVGFAKGAHRAAIINEDGDIVGILSQSDVVNELLSLHIEDFVQRGGGEPMVNRTAVRVQETDSALQGFLLMFYNKVNAVAVVNKAGQLVANLSASDLRGITLQGFSALSDRVMYFLKAVQKARGFDNVRNPVSCAPTRPLRDILVMMGQHKIHRVWCVDQNRKIVGVITQTDVLKGLVDTEHHEEAKK